MHNPLKLTLILLLLILISCEDDVEFKYDIDDLIDTRWGVPHIEEVAPNVTDYDQSAPTIFYDDGTMIIGDSRYDFWRIRNSHSLHIEKMGEIWFIRELTPNKLHVEKSTYPAGNFILRCIYYSMGESNNE